MLMAGRWPVGAILGLSLLDFPGQGPTGQCWNETDLSGTQLLALPGQRAQDDREPTGHHPRAKEPLPGRLLAGWLQYRALPTRRRFVDGQGMISEHPFLNALQGTCAGKVDVQSLSRARAETKDILTYPKLVSSVSESGLDAKKILKCCNVPGEQLQPAQEERAPPEAKAAPVALSSQQGADMVVTTKDMWTMTSMNDITRGLKPALEHRDAEVQTLPTMECKSVATSPAAAAEGHSHVFPEVNLQRDSETPKSPVRENYGSEMENTMFYSASFQSIVIYTGHKIQLTLVKTGESNACEPH
ncbi:hypothetical protein IHE44_0007758 [Lamprotornis superbus]|uniref:Uncharacterized protein n=1 Tax=Lamprotornis superbus TaxID=245042 RepID=A0A835NWH7_9PASS|nr:hypothetical protein IHE44_0007758 [Lamprotornis superbus]